MGPGIVLVSGALLFVVLARCSPVLATLLVCAVGALHAHGVVDIPEPAAVARAEQRMEAVQERSVARLSCRHVAVHASDADDVLVQQYC